MSGHSKWSQIKRQKGLTDVKRGAAFTKLGNAITISVKESGGNGDPETNFKLRLAIEKARQANMPKENIQRAIDKGKGIGSSDEILENVVYEGFGPGGTAILIETITDNKQRTYGALRGILSRGGGSLAGGGAVSFLFNLVGLITVPKNGKTLDEMFMIAAEAGAEDVEDSGEVLEIYTKADELNVVKTKLSKSGVNITEAELYRKPNTIVPISDKGISEKILNLMDLLEEADDVHKVFSNFDIIC